MAGFTKFFTTPHLLTEVNGLANSLPESAREPWHEHFTHVVKSLLEIWEPSVVLTDLAIFSRFGLADAALCHAGSDCLILTEDSRLSPWLHALGLAVLNLNELPRTLH